MFEINVEYYHKVTTTTKKKCGSSIRSTVYSCSGIRSI